MKIKYDAELLNLMSLFEKITGAGLKDCFFNKDKIVFVVQPGEMGRALGKQKSNIEKVERAVNRKIKIVEFSPDKLTFIRNLMFPLKIVDMQEEDEIVTIKGPDAKTKGLMIGARAQNLRNYEEIVRKYFPLKEIKVI